MDSARTASCRHPAATGCGARRAHRLRRPPGPAPAIRRASSGRREKRYSNLVS